MIWLLLFLGGVILTLIAVYRFDRWHARRSWRRAHEETVAEFRAHGWPIPEDRA